MVSNKKNVYKFEAYQSQADSWKSDDRDSIKVNKDSIKVNRDSILLIKIASGREALAQTNPFFYGEKIDKVSRKYILVVLANHCYYKEIEAVLSDHLFNFPE